MPKVKPSEDIQPLSAFRANAASVVQQIRETGRPVVLTQRGRSAAVLLGVEEYEALIDELELLRDVRSAEEDLDAGRGIPNEQAQKQLRARLGS